MDALDWTATASRLEAAWPGTLREPGRAAGYHAALHDLEGPQVRQVIESIAETGRAHPPPPAMLRTVALARARAAAAPVPPPPVPLPALRVTPRAERRRVAAPAGVGLGGLVALAAALAALAALLGPWVAIGVESAGGVSATVGGRHVQDARWIAVAAALGALLALAGLTTRSVRNRRPAAAALLGSAVASLAAAVLIARFWLDLRDTSAEAHAAVRATVRGQAETLQAAWPGLVAQSPDQMAREVSRLMHIGPGWGMYLALGAAVLAALAALRAVWGLVAERD